MNKKMFVAVILVITFVLLLSQIIDTILLYRFIVTMPNQTPETAEKELKHIKNINRHILSINYWYITAIQAAAIQAKYPEIIDLLLEKGADYKEPYGLLYPIDIIYVAKNSEIFKAFLKHDPTYYYGNDDSCAFISREIFERNSIFFKEMLKIKDFKSSCEGAIIRDCIVSSVLNNKSMFRASFVKRDIDRLKIILSEGYDINAKNSKGNTIFDYVKKRKNNIPQEMLDFLEEYCSKPEIVCKNK